MNQHLYFLIANLIQVSHYKYKQSQCYEKVCVLLSKWNHAGYKGSVSRFWGWEFTTTQKEQRDSAQLLQYFINRTGSMLKVGKKEQRRTRPRQNVKRTMHKCKRQFYCTVFFFCCCIVECFIYDALTGMNSFIRCIYIIIFFISSRFIFNPTYLHTFPKWMQPTQVSGS